MNQQNPSPSSVIPEHRPSSCTGRLTRLLVGLIILMAVPVFIGIAAVGGWVAWQQILPDRILPGVYVLDEHLGGRTAARATDLLEVSWRSRTIYVEDGTHAVIAAPAEFGLTLDAAQTAEAATEWSRTARAVDLLALTRAGGRMDPIWTLDTEKTAAYLREIDSYFADPAVNAGVQLVNGRLQTTPAEYGRTIDIPATVSYLQTHTAEIARSGRLKLVIAPVVPAITDTADFVAAANQRLESELTVPVFDPITGDQWRWTVPAAVWPAWLSLEAQTDGRIMWLVDPTAVSAYLQAQAADTLTHPQQLDETEAQAAVAQRVRDHLAGRDTTAAPIRIYYAEQTHTVQPGESFAAIGRAYGVPYPWVQAANPNVDGLNVGMALTIPSPDTFLPLPIVTDKRIVISIAQQRMWAYENGALKWEWPISTGIADSPTAPGVYQVQTHEVEAYAGNWDLYMPHFIGIYRPVPTADFMNGFHGFPTRNGRDLLWTNSLGSPATYGCVLVSNENSALLFDWAETGVIVEIQSG